MSGVKQFTTESFASDFVFLEGPRWHNGRLWVSDIWAETVYSIGPDGAREAVVQVPGRPSGLGFLERNTPLIVSMTERCLYRLEAGTLVQHADLSALVSADINDMVVGPDGRAYVGNMGYDLFSGAPSRQAEITLVEPDGAARTVAEGLDFPNGMALVDGGKTLVVAESFGHRVSCFSVSPDGSLTDKRVLIELPDLVPDGICADTAGQIWVAGAMGGRFVLVGRSGVMAEIDVRPRAAIACQLGGADGCDLYCLTYEGGIEEISRGQPGARVEVARVETPAAGSP